MVDDTKNTPAEAVPSAHARALLDFVVSQTSAIFYIADLSGDAPLKYVSPNVEAITGHTQEAFHGDPVYGRRHIHPDDLERYNAALRGLTRNAPVTHTYRFAAADGSWRWFRDEVRFVDPHGDSTEFIGCMVDITQQVTSERRARDSFEMFKSMLDASPIPMSMVRLHDREILFENPAIHAVFREDAETAPRTAGYYDVDPQERETYFDLLRTHGAVDHYAIRFRREDGSEFVAAHSARLIEHDGEQVVVAGIVDLTEQKRREQELELARQTLEDAIESLSEGFVLYDPDDRLVMCNSQYKVFHGDSADLLVPGAYWPEVTLERGRRGLFHEAEGDLEGWFEGQIALRGKAHREEFPFGDGRWYEYSHRKTRQGGFVSVWRDVTERIEMERELRKSAEHFRSIVEGHPLPVWLVDVKTARILYESPAAAEMVGRPWPSDTPAYTTDHIVDRELRERFNETLRSQGSVLGMEVQLRRADGSFFWASVNERLITYDGREASITSFVDLTERRAAEAELERQRERLHQNEKLSALGELLAGVAHELNNPLSILVGQALLLQESAQDSDTRARSERIATAADRCARIVRTFLAMARQEPGDRVPVELSGIIATALDVTAYSLRTSGVEVQVGDCSGLPHVFGDPDQLVQVFANLIVNAEHAVRESAGPRVLTIEADHREATDEVTVTVRDTGPGVPEEIRTRIFEPLYTTKSAGKGTGMGLALCHRILAAHGGAIELVADEGPGAAFVVRMPRAEQAQAGAVACKVPAPERQGLSILVIDDEEDVGETIADVLILDGHTVDLARTGAQALQSIAARDYDVVLSDVRMPELDGPSFYRTLVEQNPGMTERLAFITGDTLSPSVREFLDAAGRPYLEKPILPKDARELVKRLTEGVAR